MNANTQIYMRFIRYAGALLIAHGCRMVLARHHNLRAARLQLCTSQLRHRKIEFFLRLAIAFRTADIGRLVSCDSGDTRSDAPASVTP